MRVFVAFMDGTSFGNVVIDIPFISEVDVDGVETINTWLKQEKGHRAPIIINIIPLPIRSE